MVLVSIRAEVTLYGSEIDEVFSGWIASPVPAYQIVSVIVQAVNPEMAGDDTFDIPEFLGIATEPAPGSPNGAVLFGGGEGIRTKFPYGVTIWYDE